MQPRFTNSGQISGTGKQGLAGNCLEDALHGGYKDLLNSILDAELNRRGESESAFAIHQGLLHESAFVRGVTLRTLGRIAHVDWVPELIVSSSAEGSELRIEAVWALAQIARRHGLSCGKTVEEHLLKLIELEEHIAVRAVIFGALGAARQHASTVAQETLINCLESSDATPEEHQGMLFALAELLRNGSEFQAPTLRHLHTVLLKLNKNAVRPGLRFLALHCYSLAGGPLVESLRMVLRDVEPQVRRQLALILEKDNAIPGIFVQWEGALESLLRDSSAVVRWEALRVSLTQPRRVAIRHAEDAMQDSSLLIRELAIQTLPRLVPHMNESELREWETVLCRLVESAPLVHSADRTDVERVHLGAVALVALTKLGAEGTQFQAAKWAGSDWTELRQTAARYARIAHVPALAVRLVNDSNANVVALALDALTQDWNAAYLPMFLRALMSDAHQVLVAAAAGLAAHATSTCAGDVLATLARLSATGLDNTRDARIALLQTLAAVGYAPREEDLTPYLSDFDPRIAALTSQMLNASGVMHATAQPQRQPVHVPDLESVCALKEKTLLISMASGGEIELELFPELAPFTVYRMATLSGEKVFDGLCFHRHSPNWVVQGGSPLGHELVGLSPFMPDECGRHAHLRGTVGISTRSADTGDAQFFINLCDNHVLNHDYTVWARVVRGMDVVDGVLPGDTMSTVRLCTAEANARGAAETACCC